MTVEQYWAIALKRWPLIVVCFLLVGLGAFWGSKRLTPVYQSSALLQVVVVSNGNGQASYDNLLASDELVQTEATLATSAPILKQVVAHYRGLSVAELAGEVSAAPKASTQLFEIDVVDPSPTRAARLANDIAAALIQQQLQTIQQSYMQTQQQLQQNLDTTSQQINTLTQQITSLQQADAQRQLYGLPAVPGNPEKIAVLQAQLNELQQHYSQWETALAQLELTQAQGVNPLSIAQPAQIPLSPVRPNLLLNTAGGFLVGLLLGLLLALLYERLDRRVRTQNEFARLLPWTVMGTIWRSKSTRARDLVNLGEPDRNTEAYRLLRANVDFARIDQPPRTLIVTSALTREGKSVVAANLAIFTARAGKNTLLIDADLHRPCQQLLFDLPANIRGLSNAVLAFGKPGVSPSQAYQKQLFTPSLARLTESDANNESTATVTPSLDAFVYPTDIPNLWVMPTGPLPPNPSEFFASQAMQKFLAAIAECGVELIIFDAPPLLGLSETSVLTARMDAALIVVDMTRATRDKLKQLQAVLTPTGVAVLGYVANKVRYKRRDDPYALYTASQNGAGKTSSTIPLPSGVVPIQIEPDAEEKQRSN